MKKKTLISRIIMLSVSIMTVFSFTIVRADKSQSVNDSVKISNSNSNECKQQLMENIEELNIEPTENTKICNSNEKSNDEQPKTEKSVIENSKTISKTINVNGKVITLTYSKTEKANENQNNGRAVYVSGNTTAKFDVVTGQLLNYTTEILPEDDSKPQITEQEAQNLAKKVISENIDMSEYVLENCSYNKSLGEYSICYCREVLGYKTSETANIFISKYGRINSFYFNPDVFKNVDKNSLNIDKNKLLEKLDKTVKEDFMSEKYEIKEMRLKKAKNGGFVMDCFVNICGERNTFGVCIVLDI